MDVNTVLLALAKRASARILHRWPRFPLGIIKSKAQLVKVFDDKFVERACSLNSINEHIV